MCKDPGWKKIFLSACQTRIPHEDPYCSDIDRLIVGIIKADDLLTFTEIFEFWMWRHVGYILQFQASDIFTWMFRKLVRKPYSPGLDDILLTFLYDKSKKERPCEIFSYKGLDYTTYVRKLRISRKNLHVLLGIIKRREEILDIRHQGTYRGNFGEWVIGEVMFRLKNKKTSFKRKRRLVGIIMKSSGLSRLIFGDKYRTMSLSEIFRECRDWDTYFAIEDRHDEILQ